MKPYYEHAGITIYHGDCAEIVPSLPAASVALVVTSPPYNQMSSLLGKPSGLWARTSGAAGFLRAWKERGYSDDVPEAEYVAWQNALFDELASVCTSDASLFYNHQLRWRDGECLHPVRWFAPPAWRMRQEIVWNRGGGIMFNARMFVRFDERILWFVRGDAWKWNQSAVGMGTVWNISREQQQQGKLHPVAFPLALPMRCIAAASDPGDIVLDPFMGSGGAERVWHWDPDVCRVTWCGCRSGCIEWCLPGIMSNASHDDDLYECAGCGSVIRIREHDKC